MFTHLFLSLLACIIFAAESAVKGHGCGCNEFPAFPPLRHPAICDAQSAVAVALNDTTQLIYDINNNIQTVIDVWGGAQTAFVDPTYCFIPGCCTRFMTFAQYVESYYIDVVVTFISDENMGAVYNPDGSVTVYATEVRTERGIILSVRQVFWVWAPDYTICDPKQCLMTLVQFQAADFTCQFGAPPCGDCYHVAGK